MAVPSGQLWCEELHLLGGGAWRRRSPQTHTEDIGAGHHKYTGITACEGQLWLTSEGHSYLELPKSTYAVCNVSITLWNPSSGTIDIGYKYIET